MHYKMYRNTNRAIHVLVSGQRPTLVDANGVQRVIFTSKQDARKRQFNLVLEKDRHGVWFETHLLTSEIASVKGLPRDLMPKGGPVSDSKCRGILARMVAVPVLQHVMRTQGIG